MKLAGHMLLVLAAAVLEGVLPRLFGLDFARPLVVAVLVVHFARSQGTMEGALLSAFAGFVEDATSGFPTGLATFACVFLFVAARLAFGGLSAEGRFVETTFSALGALVWLGAVTAMRRTFGPPLTVLSTGSWLGSALWAAAATALVSPFVLAVARRIDKLEKRPA